MQVVAYKALDGKLFEHESQQLEYDQKYVREQLLNKLATNLLANAPYLDDVRSNAILDMDGAKTTLHNFILDMGDTLIEAVQAYQKHSVKY